MAATTKGPAAPAPAPAPAPARLVELPSDDDDEIAAEPPIPSSTSAPVHLTPALYMSRPILHDDLETATSRLQDETVDACLPWLLVDEKHASTNELNSFGIPQLRRAKHVRFLRNALELLPDRFVALDASRPWLVYWSMNSLSMLDFDLDTNVGGGSGADYRTRAISTLASCQSPSGGFGGSSHQLPHLACAYAAVLTTCLVGGRDAYEAIDRRGMWEFLCRMKQPDGGFTMCAGGEQDVRGAFCALVIASLLRLPLSLASDNTSAAAALLTDGVAGWVARCQTFEGGIAAQPGREAHGAYAFCALGALCILGAPSETIPAALDMRGLVAWLAARQLAPEGGFAGRANKLVDGCYSHWVGGCWALLEAALPSPQGGQVRECGPGESPWDREGLVRFILCCAQNPPGGLRDKPGKGPDAYHTNYNLAGLSWAQYRHVWSDADNADEKVEERPSSSSSSLSLEAPFGWSVAGREESVPCDDGDVVRALHPVFVVRYEKVDEMRRYFLAKEGVF